MYVDKIALKLLAYMHIVTDE